MLTISTNISPYHSVMDAWGKWTKTNDKLILAADGNGEFVTATGLVQGMFLFVCLCSS